MRKGRIVREGVVRAKKDLENLSKQETTRRRIKGRFGRFRTCPELFFDGRKSSCIQKYRLEAERLVTLLPVDLLMLWEAGKNE